MMRAGLSAGLALTMFGGLSGASAEGRRWIADGDSEIARLIYGTPESDDMVLNLTCERASKTMTIWYTLNPGPEKTPEKMKIL